MLIFSFITFISFGTLLQNEQSTKDENKKIFKVTKIIIRVNNNVWCAFKFKSKNITMTPMTLHWFFYRCFFLLRCHSTVFTNHDQSLIVFSLSAKTCLKSKVHGFNILLTLQVKVCNFTKMRTSLVDIGRKLNLRKSFRWRPGRVLNVL